MMQFLKSFKLTEDIAEVALLLIPLLLLDISEELTYGKGNSRYAIADVWEFLGRRLALHILKNLSTNEVIRFNKLKDR